jgi:hypothetical protein
MEHVHDCIDNLLGDKLHVHKIREEQKHKTLQEKSIFMRSETR